MKQRTGRKLIGFLFALALVLMPGMSLTAYADDPYASLKNTTTVVHFDSNDWYLIDYDNSTVTLLSKECVALSKYNQNSNDANGNIYSGSTVEDTVNTYYTNSISADAKTAVSGGGMFLLTKAQASATTTDVRKSPAYPGNYSNRWWLCSPGSVGFNAAYVSGADGTVDENGTNVTCEFGVRPALKLNLSSVIFSSESKTFSLKPAGSSVTLSGGANATIDGATSQTGLTGAMTTVTYTANTGYYFAEFADISSNGITATRTSSTVVTVSGTPTSDATITVPDAVAQSSGTTASVTTPPKAKALIYSGSAQELVTEGVAANGTMQYALGKNATTAPTDGWSADVPKGTDVGTYYVWYKAVGDETHTDSEPDFVTVTIDKAKEHTHNPEKVEAKAPGCETKGNKEHYRCSECGKLFADATCSVELEERDILIAATGHKWDDGVVTKEATYDETGIKTFTCENDSSHTKEEEIPRKVYYERESDTDNSDGSSGSSGGGSSNNSGSVSKQSIDVNGNTISSNHQAETGVPASDVGGRWANSANADIWTYTKSDGTLAKSEWMSLDYNGLRYWYYFNEDGIMLTNWFDYNGERFYLMPEKDGWRGRMATGWKNIDNKWYYFDIVPGSTQGKLYRGAITPDGHVVGADGAWNGVGETPVGQE